MTDLICYWSPELGWFPLQMYILGADQSGSDNVSDKLWTLFYKSHCTPHFSWDPHNSFRWYHVHENCGISSDGFQRRPEDHRWRGRVGTSQIKWLQRLQETSSCSFWRKCVALQIVKQLQKQINPINICEVILYEMNVNTRILSLSVSSNIITVGFGNKRKYSKGNIVQEIINSSYLSFTVLCHWLRM